jgi:DNA-binding transcriptional LysR family regulator
MDTIYNMRIFLCASEAGSFTAAATQLNTSTGQISRAIADLEAHLKTRLLNRTTRRMALTEAGVRYKERCEQILAWIEEAEAEAGDARAHPAGRLRIHSWSSFGQHYVVPAASKYQRLYPDVKLELTLASRTPDLLDEGYDVVLVLAQQLPNSGLVSQRLGQAFSILCASRKYLESNGIPRSLPDLKAHACMQVLNPVTPLGEWTFDGPDGEETVEIGTAGFQTNVAEAMVVAVREGMGISLLPIYSAAAALRSGELIWILPQYVAQEMNVFALYSSRQYLDAKIRTWIEFLRKEIPESLNADRELMKQYSNE